MPITTASAHRPPGAGEAVSTAYAHDYEGGARPAESRESRFSSSSHLPLIAAPLPWLGSLLGVLIAGRLVLVVMQRRGPLAARLPEVGRDRAELLHQREHVDHPEVSTIRPSANRPTTISLYSTRLPVAGRPM